VMASSGSSGIEKVSIDVALSVVTIDVELGGGRGRGLGSVPSLSDKERLSGGGNAVNFEVDLADGIRSGGPRAEDGSTSRSGGGLRAGEVLDVTGRIFLGIGGVSDHLDGGRVGGPDSDVGVDGLDEDVIDRAGDEVGDFGGDVVGQSEVDDARSLERVVNLVQIEGESVGIVPDGADGDDVCLACILEVDNRGRLRIGLSGSSSSGGSAGDRAGRGPSAGA